MSGAAPSSGLSGLISTLDNAPRMRVGENQHPEYDWNLNDKKETLVQIAFQCNRSSFDTRFALARRFRDWLASVGNTAFDYTGTVSQAARTEASTLLTYAYKMIAHLRDVHSGKGECRLAYDFLYVWQSFWREFASAHPDAESFSTETTNYLALRFVLSEAAEDSPAQIGSYKDFKYICHEFCLMNMAEELGEDGSREVGEKYVDTKFIRYGSSSRYRRRSGEETFRFTPAHLAFLRSLPIIQRLSASFGAQINHDYSQLINAGSASNVSLSLAGKWAPRASSKLFAPLRSLLIPTAIPESVAWLETAAAADKKTGATGIESRVYKANLKIETVYRQRLSAINKALDTVQVKQCNKTWSSIDFDKGVTSVTLNRQKKAFLKGGDEDREQCKEHFTQFLERVRKGTSTAKGKCVAVSDFVKQARSQQDLSQEEMLLLDSQWADKGNGIEALEDFIAMVDVSGSMDCDNSYPMNTAVGLGIRIAEKSRLGNRVMTFSANPTWINLADQPSFCERVHSVMRGEWGMNTNFRAALRMVLDAAVNAKLTADDVARLCLVILSDMQMDAAGNYTDALHDSIKEEFSDAGIRVCGQPYPVPKIVFWNLRTTQGFPSSAYSDRAIMVSGGSDSLLNDLCEKGLEGLESVNPWNAFAHMLDKAAYAGYRDVALSHMPWM